MATDCASVRRRPFRRCVIPVDSNRDKDDTMPSLTTIARSVPASGMPRRSGCAFGLLLALALPIAVAGPTAAQTAAPTAPAPTAPAPTAPTPTAAPTAAPAAQTGDPVVARVNGQDIHASDVNIAEEDIGSNLPQQMAGEGKRDYLTTFVADMVLVAKAAEARKIADGDDFKRRLAYFRNKLLMELLLQSEAKASITDEALHKVYDDATKQMSAEKEVRARHILVETEDEAKAVLDQIKKGADFAELAKQKSKDPGANGGDLGYFTRDQMVPEFAETAFRLDKGQLSDPVKTQFGWHVIKVEDKRDRPVPEFDKVKDQLENYVTRKAQAELVSKLRAEAKIERLDQPPAASPPAAPEAPASPQAAPPAPAAEPQK
jgi:peptidyl-prolyl cis-trans isomerase C